MAGFEERASNAKLVTEVNQTTYAFANVSRQEEGSYDNEEGPDHEEHNSQCNCLVGDFWWALLELDGRKTNIKPLNSAQFPSHHGRDANPTASRDDVGQTVAAALLQGSNGPSARNPAHRDPAVRASVYTHCFQISSDFHLPPKKSL